MNFCATSGPADTISMVGIATALPPSLLTSWKNSRASSSLLVIATVLFRRPSIPVTFKPCNLVVQRSNVADDDYGRRPVVVILGRLCCRCKRSRKNTLFVSRAVFYYRHPRPWLHATPYQVLGNLLQLAYAHHHDDGLNRSGQFFPVDRGLALVVHSFVPSYYCD